MPAQQTVEDLGKLVKQKYPGSYDSMSDIDVGQKVKAKYPQYSQFADMPAAVPAAKPTTSAAPQKPKPRSLFDKLTGTDAPMPALPKGTKVMGEPILPAEGIVSTAVGMGVEKAGEKMGLPWWIDLPAGVLAGGIAVGSGSIYERIRALPPGQRAEAFKRASTKLPWGIGKLSEAWQSLFKDVPKENVPAPPIKWPTPAAEPAPVPPPRLKFSKPAKEPTVRPPKLKWGKPAGEPQGTINAPAPPLKWGKPVAEGEEGAAVPKPEPPKLEPPKLQPPPKPEPPITRHTADPREIGMQNVAFKAQVKTDTIAKRLLDTGMTPEQVGAMSDAEINQVATETTSPITGKPYEPFRGKGQELHRSPSAGKADIVRTMREMMKKRQQ